MRSATTSRKKARAWLRLSIASVMAGLVAGSAIALPTQVASAASPSTTWTQLSPATGPPGRSFASMAYDPATRQMVLFGGGGLDYLSDTWTWNGSTWTEMSPATSPPGRSFASMAYDPATSQMLLFGGWNDQIPQTLGDTWTWNGSTWTKLSPATSPPVSFGASMAYDAAMGQMVLFGGWGNGGNLGDTWTWNGSTWTEQSPPTSPPARNLASMAYDAATGQVVLFGGSNENSGSGNFNDTWTWNGSTWTEMSPTTSPPVSIGASMAYDPATGQMVFFDGDTWLYGVASALTVSAVSPSSGPVTGGTPITIFGTGFLTGSVVKIGQGWGPGPTAIQATNVNVVSPTEITATTGGGARVGTFNLFVINSAGTSAGSAGDGFTYLGHPSVSSISPSSGPASGGTSITITGTNFVAGAVVEIGQGWGPGPTAIQATNVVVASSTKITATTGGGAKPGTFNLFVITPGGTSQAHPADSFTYSSSSRTELTARFLKLESARFSMLATLWGVPDERQ